MQDLDTVIPPDSPTAPQSRRRKPPPIGLTLSENFMLIPEQSTDALIVHHPQAKYFDV